MTNLKKTLIQFAKYLIGVLLGFYLIVLVTGEVMGLSAQKAKFLETFPDWTMTLIKHPIHYWWQYVIADHNPLALFGSIAVIGYMVFFALKSSAKHKDWETADTETHGSATWGHLKALLNKSYKESKAKDVSSNFETSLNQDTLKAIREQEERS